MNRSGLLQAERTETFVPYARTLVCTLIVNCHTAKHVTGVAPVFTPHIKCMRASSLAIFYTPWWICKYFYTPLIPHY